eukprot:TRINITY_DN5110_c0_g1_i1.p1 TRINITY_DN5110_c0_g1~~TRINITY_DN5110_c0_g1_i1.p1  ORF type:complete len:293 (-),score=90.78 TRINITY_DN5110_c0_g1_i1:360-1238(-)
MASIDVKEFKRILKSVKDTAKSLRKTISEQKETFKENPISNGLGLIEAKCHTLLAYCQCVSILMLHKLEGKSIKDHPAVMEAIKLRVILERIKPLEGKMQHQINKLLKLATSDKPMDEEDPLAFKANPDALVSAYDDYNNRGNRRGGREGSTKVYQAVKKSTMAPSELLDAEDDADLQRAKDNAAKKTDMYKHLKEKFSNKPEVIEHYSSGDKKLDAHNREVRQYEENNMLRLMETKNDKKRAKRAERNKGSIRELTKFANFNDFSRITDATSKGEIKSRKRRRTGGKKKRR